MRHLVLAAVAALSVGACARPPSPYTQSWLKPLDNDTQYALNERSGGFELIIRHEHYQYRQEEDAILATCERTFAAAAQVLAERRNHSIGPRSVQDLKMSTDRNLFTGISTCNAIATVNYAR